MFAVIYRSYLKPGTELEYQEAWNRVARFFIEHRGAFGSCLHKTADDLWVAYSRWPDKAMRDAAWPGENSTSEILPTSIKEAIEKIKDCVDQNRKLPDIEMDVMDDQLNL